MKRASLFAALCALIAACGVAGAEPLAVEPTTTTPTIATTTSTTSTSAPLVAAPEIYAGFDPTSLPPHVTIAAMAKGELAVYEAPTHATPLRTLPATTILGTNTVVTLIGNPTPDGWARASLPGRPNGSQGWIRIEDVDLFLVDGKIVVDLSDRELVYYRGDEEVLRTPVATGTARNPTPTGSFFVTDSVTLSNPTSPWGPHALGLSGRSETITEYNGGDGIIGIHGTNRPGSIGNAASLGCVRLPNDMITQIHALAPIGTPVEIQD